MPKTASLEIHQINVGQGDSTLVVLRDLPALKNCVGRAANTMEPIDYLPYCITNGRSLVNSVKKALLVDAGNDCYGFAVREYCENVGAIDSSKVSQDNFFMLVTHYHDDHHDGLRCVMRDPDPKGGKPIEKCRPAEFYRLEPFARRDRAIGTTGIIVEEIASQVVAKRGNDRRKQTEVWYIPQGGKNEAKGNNPASQWCFNLGNGVGNLPIAIKAVASERAVFAGENQDVEHVPAKPRKGKKKGTIDENDRSVALVIEYGSFRHFLAGDAGGSEGTVYADVERVLAQQMELNMPIARAPKKAKFKSAGHCCSLKLNHHGTKYANDAQFLATLRPRLAVIPAGVKIYFHGHPTKETVNRLTAASWLKQNGTTRVTNTIDQIVATEVASKGKGKSFNPDTNNRIKVLGDIVIRPVDEDILAAQTAMSNGQSIRIQVYGNREQTPLPANSTCALRNPEDAATSGNYPVAPLEVVCSQH
jgi:hypothetical protein